MNPILMLAIVAGFTATLGGDEQSYLRALEYFNKYAQSKDPAERTRAAEDLGSSTYEKRDKLTAQLIVNLLLAEINREGQGGKNEEKVSGSVLESCLGALKKVSSKDAMALLTSQAKNKGFPWRAKFYVILAMGGFKDDESHKLLLTLVDDKDPHLQIAATDALVERGVSSDLDTFMKILKENRTWETKISALKGVEKIGTAETCVEPLIEALGKTTAEEGRLKDDLIRVLKKLTGCDLPSDDPNAWKAAWIAKKEGREPGKDQGATAAEPTEFYGLKTKSTRIVFIIDRTGSMGEPGSEPEKPKDKDKPKDPPVSTDPKKQPDPNEQPAMLEVQKIKKKYDERKVQTRMDAMKKEFINAVYYLDPRVHFTVVWYESNPKAWKELLVPATWQNKLDAINDCDKMNPSGPTNIWDALELAFKLTETPQRPDVVQVDKKANYATTINGADTFFLMTDGKPNTGRIQKPDDIITEVKKVNVLRKVVIHTVCVGDDTGQDPPDPTFLKKVAQETGGEFVHVKR